MSGPPVCSTCGGAYLLWWRGTPVGPGWPTQASASPMCWWHDVERQMSNGGLPEAPPDAGDVLARMLQSWDRRDEREALRLRGVTYSVQIGGEMRTLTV